MPTLIPAPSTGGSRAHSEEYKQGYEAALNDVLHELDNQLGTARNRNEYQRGRVDMLHDLRTRLRERKASL